MGYGSGARRCASTPSAAAGRYAPDWEGRPIAADTLRQVIREQVLRGVYPSEEAHGVK